MFKSRTLDASLIKPFEESLVKDKIKLYRVVALLTSVMLVLTFNLDAWAIPSAQQEVFYVRLFIIVCMLASCVTTFFEDFFIKNYNVILVSSFLSMNFSVCYVIHLSQATELAYYTYFSVMIISMLNMFSWTYLSAKLLLFTAVLIHLGYVVAIVTRDHQGPHGEFAIVGVTLTLMSGAAVFGYLGTRLRDKHLYEKFRLQQSFKNLFEEKAQESKDHEYDACHDSLTHLPNRRFLESDLMLEFTSPRLHQEITIVLFLDLNGFKMINDNFGHNAGDHVLKVTAQRLAYCINKSDKLIRLGGDEFLILFKVASSQNEKEIIHTITERVQNSIKQDIDFEGNTLHISTSIGIASSRHDGDDLHNLIEIADFRMFDEKKNLKKLKHKKIHRVSSFSYNGA